MIISPNENKTLPIVVDLDGTLTPTDTLLESLIRLIKKSPLNLFRLPFWLIRGRAEFKCAIAKTTRISATSLPYHEELLTYLRQEKRNGRKIILATAAHQSIAKEIYDHFEFFDGIIASDANTNLKGTAKLAAIQNILGNNFVYAGDSLADIPIWRSANAAILVSVNKQVTNLIKANVAIEKEFTKKKVDLNDWLRALRVHQWIKNLLLFVPLLTAFSFFDIENIVRITNAFLAFSLAASATYIANDLWDLENDRSHPKKRFRPFACGKIKITNGIFIAFFCLSISFALAYQLSATFIQILIIYLALTTTYSLFLKEYVLVDVITLSSLYTLRILAGSIAIGVSTSSWLLAFSVFLFISLALIKRCAELVVVESSGMNSTKGRDYRVSDLVVLWPLGIASAFSAVVVFGLFISSPETQLRYSSPNLLWSVAIMLIYWLSRLWIKTSRGEMHDDPVVFAIMNKGSRITIAVMFLCVLTAYLYH